MDHILQYVFFLACPISMGVMMWMMMRNHDRAPTTKTDPRLSELESQVNELRMALHERQNGETATAEAVAANPGTE